MTTAHARIFYKHNIYNFTDNNTTSNIMPLANLTVPWSEQHVTEKVVFLYLLNTSISVKNVSITCY